MWRPPPPVMLRIVPGHNSTPFSAARLLPPPFLGSTSNTTRPETRPVTIARLFFVPFGNHCLIISLSVVASLIPFGVIGCFPGRSHCAPFGHRQFPPSIPWIGSTCHPRAAYD